MKLLRISWNAVTKYCEELAEKTSPFRPDMIIGISRGGIVPARILSDVLGIKKLGIIGVAFYRKAGKKGMEPEITQHLDMEIAGKRVLLVDDVSDTGNSLVFVKRRLEKKRPKEVKTATLHYKPHSVLKPDYFIGTTEAWIVYPWERHEVERELKEQPILQN
ncbi:phosphoribosyltransferase [Candidatus Micrarchaeota archaeon]|nr:phosphoribosyltransferase [Candidatus Micrarchaeota archaeon]